MHYQLNFNFDNLFLRKNNTSLMDDELSHIRPDLKQAVVEVVNKNNKIKSENCN